MERGKIVLAGGSGFLGRVLAAWFDARGWEVVVLSRRAAQVSGARVVRWDGERLGDWARELEGAAALVNLAGRSVNCRYHARNRRLMMDSRVNSTRVLGEAARACAAPPAVWINSSTATIYKHTFGPAHGEYGETGWTPEAKDKFSIEVATAWEREFESASAGLPATRKAVTRSAMVLGAQDWGNNVFVVLRRLARLGLGGAMAGGRQFVSWIHEEDFCRAIEWLIAVRKAAGVYNLASPNPLPNRELMQAFRRVCARGTPGRLLALPAAAWMLEVGAVFLRTETELIVKSRRVVPARLLMEGFEFQFAALVEALNDLEQRLRAARQKTHS
jgi:hypothetical protein